MHDGREYRRAERRRRMRGDRDDELNAQGDNRAGSGGLNESLPDYTNLGGV
jgi:hypothetical protein